MDINHKLTPTWRQFYSLIMKVGCRFETYALPQQIKVVLGRTILVMKLLHRFEGPIAIFFALSMDSVKSSMKILIQLNFALWNPAGREICLYGKYLAVPL